MENGDYREEVKWNWNGVINRAVEGILEIYSAKARCLGEERTRVTFSVRCCELS